MVKGNSRPQTTFVGSESYSGKKIPRPVGLAGSNPVSGTNLKQI
jgi:hypothetical protein